MCTNFNQAFRTHIGSSLICKAYQHVKSRPLEDNIGLQHYWYNIIWLGHPGLKFIQVSNICNGLINTNLSRPPAYLIINAGGYEIREVKWGLLRYNLKKVIYYLHAPLSYICITWSNNLPRIKWCYSINTKAM